MAAKKKREHYSPYNLLWIQIKYILGVFEKKKFLQKPRVLQISTQIITISTFTNAGCIFEKANNFTIDDFLVNFGK